MDNDDATGKRVRHKGNVRCGAIRVDGRPCQAFRAAGRDTCASHDPDTIRKRRNPVWQAVPERGRPYGTVERAELERERLQRRIAESDTRLTRLRSRLAAVEARLARYQ